MSRLILVLGDQLSETLSALEEADKSRDVVVMAEVADEASYVQHHPKKIALIFAAMRKFAARLREDGWDVRYTALDDTENTGSIPGELMRRADECGAKEVVATQPGEFRLIQLLDEMSLPVRQLRDTRFLTDLDWFEDWAEGRKSLRMEYFYREMRKKTGYLMEDGEPAGGKWNFDHDNRKPAPDEVDFGGPMEFTPDETVEEVLALVEARFGNSFGDLRPFWFATDQGQARRALTHFVKHALPRFGDFQDAMMGGEKFLYHAVISGYMNIGLLDPREVCEAVEEAWRAGDAPINAVEGFIRQVIGWREYMRAIYFREGPDYPSRNWLNHQRKLPPLYWGAETKMRCLSKAVEETREEAYAHHIQRLMVTGNFALLAGIDPAEVEEWYMRVYFDAFEWVTAPNTVGMSQFADGGVIASKPYVSSGNYIDKMSDYCGDCAYSVKKKTGEGACPFNLLYWHFMDRHRDKFAKNPRMAQMYATWDRMKDDRKETVLREAEDFLDRMSKEEVV
ncbi:Deoxyribodipyrimidine photo-lyase-related protein [Roseivivax sp. THAF40]|uniref:cryptochrome/photolyase family protein n=1 Tax=unclassified Roseivivax TaxID=2639302 RepID=UPI001267BA89|nr:MULTISPECIES: cryptochrome/photolyase family protein [unclassified Roseivivax]QFS82075.1 Deoxyribodipyrimidine photo-lyase-related protein [Roseivivax sp. THAF197b]QFT45875.1 Deoxyribodipyrimidine photo-lyase-related protein [Roseivivax sp. THAF40]